MNQTQYIRKSNLVVSNDAGDGLDLSGLRLVFAIKKTDGETPNTGNFRIYGLNQNTASRIRDQFTRISFQAGYESNFGVIFDGNIKRTGKGNDSNVDSYLEIQAADGDLAYNFATVNATISAGATQRDQIEAAAKVMNSKGVSNGYNGIMDQTRLPRGKVMYGMSRDYIRKSAATSGASWTIQDGVLKVIPMSGLLPGQAVVLNSKTGLVGIPKQTDSGIEFRCLLNPLIVVAAAIQIDQKDIARAQLQEENPDKPAPAEITIDGFYRVISLEYSGDTRGNDWYCEGTGLSVDSTVAASNSVQSQ